MATSPLTDKNPKDHILFVAHPPGVSLTAAGRDNTGHRVFDSTVPFPTTTFPSDHAVLFATFHNLGDADAMRDDGDARCAAEDWAAAFEVTARETA